MMVAAGEPVESTTYDSSSWETRFASDTGRTVAPVSTVLIEPPWWNTRPMIQQKNFALCGPITILAPAQFANFTAPPVRVHMPTSPPRAHRYTRRIRP
jgi:hypothetical protein